MKKLSLFISAFALFATAGAQNYYHVEYTADVTRDYIYADYQTMGSVVMTKTLNDKLSDKQTIPFDFSFYGQNVNEYLVSDNGYITFNTSETVSDGTPMALPAGGGPNNAIYAFWQDFEMKSAPNPNFPVNVYNYTKGTTPNRTHVIQWFGLSIEGKAIAANADVYAFAIVLHESDGTFDIINGSYGTSSTKGTIGTENSDGTVGYALSGSPSVPFPVASSTAPADLSVFRFYYGTQVANDVGVVSAELPRMTKTAEDVTLSATVVNFGTENVISFDFNYTVDGGTVETKQYSGLNVPSGGSVRVTHNTKWSAGTVGKDYEFDIYTSNVNGGADDFTGNDHLMQNILVNAGLTTDRIVLAEESTGAWCGYCPDGHSTAKTVNEVYPDVIFVKHHFSDGMETPESRAITTTFADGYPDMIVDRTLNSGSRTQWITNVGSRRTSGAPVDVAIENKNFNSSTREITYDVKVTFADDYAGDLRIGSIIMEDYVRGPSGNQWDQVNYYSKDYPGGVNNPSHVMYEETSPMVGYYHNHVAIAMPNGSWGTDGVIPEVAKKGESFTLKVTYKLPAMTVLPGYFSDNNTDWCSTITDGEYQWGANKPADIFLVGFVASHDDFDARNRPILNAGGTKLWDIAAGISTSKLNASLKIYPNPATDIINIEVEDRTENAVVRVLDVSGKVVLRSELAVGATQLDMSSLNNGIYVLEVETESTKATEKLVINK